MNKVSHWDCPLQLYLIVEKTGAHFTAIVADEHNPYLPEHWIHLGSMFTQWEFPEIDIDEKQIEVLKAAIEKVRADAQVEVNRLEERIGELLSLPAPTVPATPTDTKWADDQPDEFNPDDPF